MIISGQAEDSSALYIAVNKLIPNLIKQEKEDTEEYQGEGDFTLDLKSKQAHFNGTWPRKSGRLVDCARFNARR